MHHIIRDHLLSWTYNTLQAIQGLTLETLAKGNVKVHLSCGKQNIILVFWNCLHAPSAPINLISVGVMQE